MNSKKILLTNILFLFCVLLLGIGGCRFQGDTPVQVKILSYNIYHGANAHGGSNLEAIGRIIDTLQPDLVALQEVDKQTTRVQGKDLTAILSSLTGMEGIFGKAMDYAGGGYGEAILSRYPILKTRNHPLPHAPNAEPRSALEVRVALPNRREILFVGTHLDHLRTDQNRIDQVQQINDLYLDGSLPIILAGDLNATPGSEPMKILSRYWADASKDKAAPTFPAKRPQIKIDYVLYRPDTRWRVITSKVIDEKIASDHCPIFVVLELLPPR